jgi:hypothetical protein
MICSDISSYGKGGAWLKKSSRRPWRPAERASSRSPAERPVVWFVRDGEKLYLVPVSGPDSD